MSKMAPVVAKKTADNLLNEYAALGIEDTRNKYVAAVQRRAEIAKCLDMLAMVPESARPENVATKEADLRNESRELGYYVTNPRIVRLANTYSWGQ